jgi:hypothetical protein
MLRRHWLSIIVVVSIALLPGCGQNFSSTGTNPPSPTPASTVSTGPVTLHVGAKFYHPGDTIEVTLSNTGTSTIYFPDHLTNCTVIELQRQVNGSWEIVQRCLLMIPTRWHTLDAGQSLTVKLVPASNHQWVAGLYRATLSYRTSLEVGTPTPIYSSEFQVS